jgi:hypothetical protein
VQLDRLYQELAIAEQTVPTELTTSADGQGVVPTYLRLCDLRNQRLRNHGAVLGDPGRCSISVPVQVYHRDSNGE